LQPIIKTVHDQTAWDQALLGLPDPHVLQSWAWGDFKSRWGWMAERLLWLDQGQPAAAAQILARPIPYTPWRFLYATKGPILDYSNPALVGQVLADLEAYAKKVKALFVKIDPDVVRQYGEPQAHQPPEPAGQALLALLEQRGWRFSPEQIQFRNTVLLDLSVSLDDLLAGMKSKWSYNLCISDVIGVVIVCLSVCLFRLL
jgi:lipid II:glycine glycyltransferase (peptidoglycan interpeptide bridge formation enzyme)